MAEEFTGPGELFLLKVRGDSMVDVGIYDGDHVVVRSDVEVRKGDIVVAGIPGGEATVKTHVSRVLAKLDLTSRSQAVGLAYETGLVQPGQVKHSTPGR